MAGLAQVGRGLEATEHSGEGEDCGGSPNSSRLAMRGATDGARAHRPGSLGEAVETEDNDRQNIYFCAHCASRSELLEMLTAGVGLPLLGNTKVQRYVVVSRCLLIFTQAHSFLTRLRVRPFCYHLLGRLDGLLRDINQRSDGGSTV